jgi:quinol monooxygenase YgiN
MNIEHTLTSAQAAVTLFVKAAAKSGSVTKAREALLADVNGARTEAGNLKMELYQAPGEPDNFYLIERWQNQLALENHFIKPYTAGAFDLQKADLTAPIEMIYLADLWPLEEDLQKQSHRPLTTLIVPFETKPGKEEEFINLFESFVPMVRKEAGNAEFHFLKVNDSDNRFVLYERWENQSDLDAHNALPSTSELVNNVSPLLTRPVIDFVLVVKDIS